MEKNDKRQALKNSADLVKEAQKLIASGHFAGSRATKILAVTQYLQALEEHIRSEIKEMKD